MKRSFGFGWCELIVGLLLVALGVFTFLRPDSVLTGAVIIYGIIAVVMGIEDIIIYARLSRFTGFGPTVALVSGIFSVMCGAMITADPEIGKWALTVLIPVWFMAHCIGGLTRAGVVRLVSGNFRYVITLIVNILGLVLGFFMIFSPAMSFMTLRILSYIAAVYFIIFGAESIISAFTGES